MRGARQPSIVGLAIAVAVLGSGCGAGSGPSSQVGEAAHVTHCGPSGHGGTAPRIVIRDADLTCRQAEAFMLVVPDSPGEFHIHSEKPDEEVVRCRVYPKASAGASVRCWVASGEIELLG
jgi:hypothetical protein